LCIREVCSINLPDCEIFFLAAENFPAKSVPGDQNIKHVQTVMYILSKKKKEKKSKNVTADKALVQR